MTNNLNDFFEVYGLRTRFEPLQETDTSTDNLEAVLKAIETKLGLSKDEGAENGK